MRWAIGESRELRLGLSANAGRLAGPNLDPSDRKACYDQVFFEATSVINLIGGADSMRAWRDLTRIVHHEERNFERAPEKQTRLIALLFCRPELSLMKSDIIPSLAYFHERSGDNTAFYFAGFNEFTPIPSGYEELGIPLPGKDPDYDASAGVFVGPEGRYWSFDFGDFNRLRGQVEQRTRWRYSGGCDMLFANSRRGVGIDFSTAIVLQLDKISEMVATPTISQLFEAIFQYAERQVAANPTWGLSDYLALKTARSGLWDVIIGILPESVRKSIKAAGHVVVRDISLQAAEA